MVHPCVSQSLLPCEKLLVFCKPALVGEELEVAEEKIRLPFVAD